MPIYRGAGGAGDATADSASEALLIRDLAVEVQADADAAAGSASSASTSATAAATSATSASNSATAAATSATNASNSASTATTQASNAATSATAAQTAETAAELAETNAETAETNASNSASAAASSASAASTSATNAANSATAAATSATNSANSATASATSATNSANSATAAAGSATTASTQATNAASSATAAASSATAAAGSATSAAGSATTATTQAGIATTQATNASTSASNAATSATTATTQAGIATTQATNASNSATAAATSATNSANSASAASTSATNAANSATAAAASAASINPASIVITGGSINGTTVGATTPSTGKFTTLEATGVTTVQAGSVSAPAITTTGDTNTGIFFPAADTIAFTEGGVESVRIDSSGNLGIGTNNPTTKLQVQGQTTFGTIGTSGNYAITYPPDVTGTAVFWQKSDGYLAWGTGVNPYSGGVERMRIDSSGNLGIGTNSPASKLNVSNNANSSTSIIVSNTNGGASASARFAATNGTSIGEFGQLSTTFAGYGVLVADAAYIYAGNNRPITIATDNNYIAFGAGTGATERMRIDSSGNLGIGTNSPGQRLDVSTSGNIQARLGNSVAGAQFTYDIGRVSATGLLQFFGNQTTATGYSFNGVDGERMRIDPNGRITKPFQPSFMAYAPGTPGNAGATFVFNPNTSFNAVAVNIGSHFNSTNGRFTAPVAGRYFFSYGVLAGKPIGQDIRTAFAVNGSPTSNGSYSGVDGWISISQVINLNANDYVQSGFTTGNGNANHCEFTGFLIG